MIDLHLDIGEVAQGRFNLVVFKAELLVSSALSDDFVPRNLKGGFDPLGDGEIVILRPAGTIAALIVDEQLHKIPVAVFDLLQRQAPAAVVPDREPAEGPPAGEDRTGARGGAQDRRGVGRSPHLGGDRQGFVQFVQPVGQFDDQRDETFLRLAGGADLFDFLQSRLGRLQRSVGAVGADLGEVSGKRVVPPRRDVDHPLPGEERRGEGNE